MVLYCCRALLFFFLCLSLLLTRNHTYPPKGVCESRSPEAVHFSKFPGTYFDTSVSMANIGLREISKTFYLVGEWVVILYPLRFPLFAGMLLTSIMCLLLIWCQKWSTAFRSKVMIDLSLKFGKIKADIILVIGLLFISFVKFHQLTDKYNWWNLKIHELITGNC